MVLSSAEIQAMVYQLLDRWDREDYRPPFTMDTLIGFNMQRMLENQGKRADEAMQILNRIRQLRKSEPEGQKKYI